MATPNYKLKDDHVITAAHGRQIYSSLDTAKLNKSGGIITGPIYQNTDASEMT